MHQFKYKIIYTSTDLHKRMIYTCIWATDQPTNPLFVRHHKYITPIGKRLHAGYIQKRSNYKYTI